MTEIFRITVRNELILNAFKSSSRPSLSREDEGLRPRHSRSIIIIIIIVIIMMMLLMMMTKTNKQKIAFKGTLRREPSPTRTLKWPGLSRVQITCNTSSAYHVQYVVLRATWYGGTAQLLSMTEFKSHLFELYLEP